MKADELKATVTADLDENFSEDSFKRSWQQAINGETAPLSELWIEVNVLGRVDGCDRLAMKRG